MQQHIASQNVGNTINHVFWSLTTLKTSVSTNIKSILGVKYLCVFDLTVKILNKRNICTVHIFHLFYHQHPDVTCQLLKGAQFPKV